MIIEQVDDLPLIGHQLRQMGLPELLETHFPDHGHWKGISGGQVLFGWLMRILTEGDHRLSHVEDWAEKRLHTLSAIMKEPGIRSLDFCDDRLGRLLDRLSDEEAWERFECDSGRQIIQVYQPADDAPQVVRADSFNVPQFREPGDLFRHGYSKQRRADQPFCKAMVGYIDSPGTPLAVDVIKGSGPDVDHYLPVIKRIQKMMARPGNLYAGDSQLCSMPNRQAIHAAGDYYLCPLSHKQVSKEKLAEYLQNVKGPAEDLPGIFNTQEDKRKPAYFLELKEILSSQEGGEQWTERRILVYSPDYARGLVNSFNNRLNEAEQKIKELVISKSGRRNPATIQQLHVRIGSVIEKYKVDGCFDIACQEQKNTIDVQKHKNRPAYTKEIITLGLSIARKPQVIEEAIRRTGWQIYASNAPEDLLSTAQLVKLYRDEYRIEHLFDYYANRDVSLLPLYLKKENRIKALVRLLSLAMKCSMLIQYRTRLALQQKEQELSGIYPGNKGRKTDKPTTPMILGAFRGLAIACDDTNDSMTFQMTPLNSTQLTILNLLQTADIYAHTLRLLKTDYLFRET
jgi:transposase